MIYRHKIDEYIDVTIPLHDDHAIPMRLRVIGTVEDFEDGDPQHDLTVWPEDNELADAIIAYDVWLSPEPASGITRKQLLDAAQDYVDRTFDVRPLITREPPDHEEIVL